MRSSFSQVVFGDAALLTCYDHTYDTLTQLAHCSRNIKDGVEPELHVCGLFTHAAGRKSRLFGKLPNREVLIK